MRINNEAVVTIIFGFSALSKKRTGLKKIPPPIPIVPDTKPRTDPIKIEKVKLNFLTTKFAFS